MTSHPGHPRPAPVRAALRRLPRWVTVLGVILVAAELTGAAALAASAATGPRRVVLQISNAYTGDDANYTTPSADGDFDIPDETPAQGQGGWSGPGPGVSKAVTVLAGKTVTIRIFNGYGDVPLTCSITANGKVLSRATAAGFWDNATCRATIP